MQKLNVLVAGSTGYIGIQLLKLLSSHSKVNIKYLCGNTSVGKKISLFDRSLSKFKLPKIVKFNKNYLNNIDVVFTALPNGEAQILSNKLKSNNILIDLSADFRISNPSIYKKFYKNTHKSIHNISKSVYFLPEIHSNKIKKYKIVSCPGCYPTSLLIPIIPLLRNKLIKKNNIVIDSKSGYSGAGRGVHKKHKKNNLYESLSSYGVGHHRHNSEINQEFAKISKNVIYNFTPHLTPMFRGILSTIYLDLPKGINAKKILIFLKKEFKHNEFIKFAKFNEPISTNSVINSNNCLLSICETKYKNRIILFSAIDNLIKGGAGQAVQNMNIYFGLKESLGLK
tara:strand:- start:940 stop:1959 length:1020 start_codon:yes stop_codon:yes gene_type:complete